MGSPSLQPPCCFCADPAGMEPPGEACALLPDPLPRPRAFAASRGNEPQTGEKVELSPSKVSGLGMGDKCGGGSAIPLRPRLSAPAGTGGTENRRKHQQKKDWGMERRTGLSPRRGFHRWVLWPGWHRVPRPRRGRGLSRRRTSIVPRCHNYSEVLASTGGRKHRDLVPHRWGSPGAGAADGAWEQGGSLPPSCVYKQIKN